MTHTANPANSTRPALHGWIVLDKPHGLGSTQAVGAIKRIVREGGYPKVKVGHGGTLDPLAEGVLPIALGEATKLCGRMLDAAKIYDFTIGFGEQTDTLDAEGEVVEKSDRRPSLDDICAVLDRFTGTITQTPPAYSAIKIDGKRAYDRARAGEKVAVRPRTVTVHSLGLSARPRDFDRPIAPGEPIASITLTAQVSKGTYIRSLARDIAHALQTCGHVTYLRRTKAGPFTEKQAISLDKLENLGKGARLQDLLLPLEAGLDDIPALALDRTSAQAVRQGRVLSDLPQADGLYCARHDDVPIALMELEGGTARVVRGFNLP